MCLYVLQYMMRVCMCAGRCVHVNMCFVWLSVYVLCVCACVCVCACEGACVCVCMQCKCVHAMLCVHVCACVCMCVHVCACACTCVCYACCHTCSFPSSSTISNVGKTERKTPCLVKEEEPYSQLRASSLPCTIHYQISKSELKTVCSQLRLSAL